MPLARGPCQPRARRRPHCLVCLSAAAVWAQARATAGRRRPGRLTWPPRQTAPSPLPAGRRSLRARGCAAGCRRASSDSGARGDSQHRPRLGRAPEAAPSPGSASRLGSSGAVGSNTRRCPMETYPGAQCPRQPTRTCAPSRRSVAQDQVSGRRPAEDAVERREVVDALAVVTPLPRDILIDVRHRLGVGVNTCPNREDAREPRGRGAWQARAHARLDDSRSPSRRCAHPRQVVVGSADARSSRPDGARRPWEAAYPSPDDDEAHPAQGARIARTEHPVELGIPREEAAQGSSFPRLRSQPIHRPSPSLHRRCRWNRKKRPGPTSASSPTMACSTRPAAPRPRACLSDVRPSSR